MITIMITRGGYYNDYITRGGYYNDYKGRVL